MALKAKKPEAREKRLKMFVYGKAGVGKTLAALKFPNAYILDTERGTDDYANTINEAGSVVLQTLDIDEIKAEIKELLTTKHEYKTLIIDPVTQIYNQIQDKWNKKFELEYKEKHGGQNSNLQDWGMRFWGKVKSDYKSFQRLLLALDMNVIITAHQKDVYTGMSKTGVTFDSMRGDDYFFDMVFRIVRKGGDKRVAITEKERAEIGGAKFPEEFEWSYDNFCDFYGKDIIEKVSEPVAMATEEQVLRLQKLITTLNVSSEDVQKWLDKAKVDNLSELNSSQIDKCIKKLEDNLKELQPEKEEAKKCKAKQTRKA